MSKNKQNDVPKKVKKAFHFFNVDKSSDRLDHLKETLNKTEIGRDALNFLKENKIETSFDKTPNTGYYSPEENRIALNPYYSDADLALAFIHGARHAQQNTVMEGPNPKMTVDTMFKAGYMMEADACAAECVLAHQMNELGDDSILKAHQKSPHKPVSQAFENEFAKSGDMDKAKTAAVLKWYDLPEKQAHALSYVEIMKTATKAEEKDPSFFTQSLRAPEIAKKILVNQDGKRYFKDMSNLLECADKINVEGKAADKLVKAGYELGVAYKRSNSSLGLDHVYEKLGKDSYNKISFQIMFQASQDAGLKIPPSILMNRQKGR